jgi:rhodanese-related sulfurtransferase
MTTINPMRIATLIAYRKPFDLIDVRPREEFDRLHIPGARSVPLKEMSPPRVVSDHKLKTSGPLFVVCRNRALASLATGMLRAAGFTTPVVVEGGMQAWENLGLPAVPTRRFHFPSLRFLFLKRKG